MTTHNIARYIPSSVVPLVHVTASACGVVAAKKYVETLSVVAAAIAILERVKGILTGVRHKKLSIGHARAADALHTNTYLVAVAVGQAFATALYNCPFITPLQRRHGSSICGDGNDAALERGQLTTKTQLDQLISPPLYPHHCWGQSQKCTHM